MRQLEQPAVSVGSASFDHLYRVVDQVLSEKGNFLRLLIVDAFDFFEPQPTEDGSEIPKVPTVAGIFDELRKILQAPKKESVGIKALLRDVSISRKGINVDKLNVYQSYIQELIEKGELNAELAALVLDQFLHFPLPHEAGQVYHSLVKSNEVQSIEDEISVVRQQTEHLLNNLSDLGEINPRNEQLIISIGSSVSSKTTGARFYIQPSFSQDPELVIRKLVEALESAGASDSYLKVTGLDRSDFVVLYAGELDLLAFGPDRISAIEEGLNVFFADEGIETSLAQENLATGLPVRPGVTLALIPPIDLLITTADTIVTKDEEKAKKSYNHLYALMITWARALAQMDFIKYEGEDKDFDLKASAKNYYRQIQLVCGINPDTLMPNVMLEPHLTQFAEAMTRKFS